MAVPLRADFDAVGVRCWARKSKDGPQARQLPGAGGDFMREPVGTEEKPQDWQDEELGSESGQVDKWIFCLRRQRDWPRIRRSR